MPTIFCRRGRLGAVVTDLDFIRFRAEAVTTAHPLSFDWTVFEIIHLDDALATDSAGPP